MLILHDMSVIVPRKSVICPLNVIATFVISHSSVGTMRALKSAPLRDRRTIYKANVL